MSLIILNHNTSCDKDNTNKWILDKGVKKKSNWQCSKSFEC